MARRPSLRFFLDNCVPDSVGQVLTSAGHHVIYQREVIASDSPDVLVALTSIENDAILVTSDRDFRTLATRLKVSDRRLRKLSRIDLQCTEPEAARRVQLGLSFIEAEWELSRTTKDRRMFLVVQGNAFKTVR